MAASPARLSDFGTNEVVMLPGSRRLLVAASQSSGPQMATLQCTIKHASFHWNTSVETKKRAPQDQTLGDLSTSGTIEGKTAMLSSTTH